MVVGAGFGLDGCRRARQFIRDMNLSRDVRRIRVKDYLDPESRTTPDRETFACFVLCGQCGYLDRERGHDPFRGAEHRSGGHHHPCPGCGARAWYNLNQVDTALALRDSEVFERRYHDELASRRARRWGLGVGTSMALPLAWGLITTAGTSVSLAIAVGSLMLLAVTALVYRLAAPRVQASLRQLAVCQAYTRWNMALPRPRSDAPLLSATAGPLRAADDDAELLRAPLSGRPCLGYELRILHDYAADDDPRTSTCVLREQRCVDVAVGDALARGGTITLDLHPTTVAEDALALDRAALELLLRKRGLYLGDGPYLLQEAVVEPGGHYELRRLAGDGGDLHVLAATNVRALPPAPSLPELPAAA